MEKISKQQILFPK